MVHLGHVHVVAVGVKRVGVVSLAQKAGRASLADHVAFLQWPRQHHKRQHRHRLRLKADELRAEVGKVFRAGRLELTRWADLVGRVARHHLVDRRRVIEQPVGRIAHRPDEGELVGDLRQLGQDLGHLDAGNLGRDRLEHAADVVRNVFLGVPEVEMARTSLQIEHDDALGLAPAGTSARLGTRADTACSSSIDPRPRPSRPEPPTRSTSRRVTPNCGSHRSFPDCPGTMIIASLLVSDEYEADCKLPASLPHIKQLLYRVETDLSCGKWLQIFRISHAGEPRSAPWVQA